MSKGKFESKSCRRRRSFGSKPLALVLACVLLVGCVIGGTVAWLTAKTEGVTNTFTTSDIEITLQEHTYDPDKDELTASVTEKGVDNYKMIPGWTVPKDPWLTVKANSEDCYLFIKVEEKGGNIKVNGTDYTFDDFIDYKIDPNNWNQLKDENGNDVIGVYVYTVPHKRSDKDSPIKILGYDNNGTFVPNTVLVKDTVTKEMMDAVTDSNKPTLIFTAYASQYWKDNTTPFTAIEAWNNVKPANP